MLLSVDKILDCYRDPIEITLTTLDDDSFTINADVIRMFENRGLIIDNYFDNLVDAFCARSLVLTHEYYKNRVLDFDIYSELVAREIICCVMSHKSPEEILDDLTYDGFLQRFIKRETNVYLKKKLLRCRIFTS